MGPVTYMVIEFPGSNFRGEIAPELDRLVDAGLIRVLDLCVVRKDTDGAIEVIEVGALPDAAGQSLARYAPPSPGLFNEQDIALLAEALDAGSAAGFLLIENLWAERFIETIANADGRFVLLESVPQPVVEEALAALPA